MVAKRKKSAGEWFSTLSLPILLVGLMVFFGIASPAFFTPLNITNILVQNVHVVVVTCAVFMIMISGGCDLSIGYQMSCAAVICAKLMSETSISPIIVIILAIVLCAALGTFNGYMSYLLNSHVMIITLGTMAIFQGISYLISGSKTYHNLPKSFMIMGQGRIGGVIPINVIIMVVIIAVVGFVMTKTSIGRKIYAAGDNPEAARLAGLAVNKIKILCFTVGGCLVGLAAILITSRAGSGDSSTGTGLEFTGITACVLAGVALKGGEGTFWKVIVAVYILGVLTNGMQLINLGVYPQYIAKGAIMLISLYLSNKAAKKAA